MSVNHLFQEFLDTTDSTIRMTEKQVNIISAAIEIFAEKGFAATSTSEIAKKAGVAEGTIFRHYKTKKDLLLSIPEYISEFSFSKLFLANFDTVIENLNLNFEEFLREIIQNCSHFAAENMMLIKVLFQELPFHPDLRMKISQTLIFPIRAKFIKAIDAFKEQGQIINIPSTLVLKHIFTSIFIHIFTHHIAFFGEERDSENEKETELLIQFIMNGVSTSI